VLLGLEILVAADLIRTVAVAPTLDNVLVLGMIVLIRTFLSFLLEIEIDGILPWRRATGSGPESASLITDPRSTACPRNSIRPDRTASPAKSGHARPGFERQLLRDCSLQVE
jgi:hypothetical protein